MWSRKHEHFRRSLLTEIQQVNRILHDQGSLEQRTKAQAQIEVFTDFGGNFDKKADHSLDPQTLSELSSLAWQTTGRTKFKVNDGAVPLSRHHAAVELGNTYPWDPENALQNLEINKIVVHVIDPGVGNDDQEGGQSHPRSLIVRKDGICFIGPDNGNLTEVLPPGSYDPKNCIILSESILNASFGINSEAGGTFHGRDIFKAAALALATRKIPPRHFGKQYSQEQDINRFGADDSEYQKARNELGGRSHIVFHDVQTDEWIHKTAVQGHPEYGSPEESQLFHEAIILHAGHNPIHSEDDTSLIAKNRAFKLNRIEGVAPEIIVINNLTNTIYVGPDNGLGTTYFKGFERDKEVQVFSYTPETAELLETEPNKHRLVEGLKQGNIFNGKLREIEFNQSLERDNQSRPLRTTGRVWLDCFGNIKTTAAEALTEAKNTGQLEKVIIQINGENFEVDPHAESFGQVPEGTLITYNGSTGIFGKNPEREHRLTEIAASVHGAKKWFAREEIDARLADKGLSKITPGAELVIDFIYN